MTTTPITHKQVVDLLEHSAYKPSTVTHLEEYVKEQAKSASATDGDDDGDAAPYYFDANRTLLKHYTFFPHLLNNDNDKSVSTSSSSSLEMISVVLLLALLEYPNMADFGALSCLVNEKIQATNEPTSTIMRCMHLLDSCLFQKFWTVYEEQLCGGDDASSSSLLSNLAKSSKSKNRLNLAILKTLALTYRQAPLGLVEQSVSHKDFIHNNNSASTKDVVDFIKNDIVVFVATPENTKRMSVFKEGVNFAAVSQMMTTVGAGGTTTAAAAAAAQQ